MVCIIVDKWKSCPSPSGQQEKRFCRQDLNLAEQTQYEEPSLLFHIFKISFFFFFLNFRFSRNAPTAALLSLCWNVSDGVLFICPLRSCPVCPVDVGVSSAVLVSRQDEAWWDDSPCRRSSPLPPLRAVSDLWLQQSPLCERRQQVSHPGKATRTLQAKHTVARRARCWCWIYTFVPLATPSSRSKVGLHWFFWLASQVNPSDLKKKTHSSFLAF